MTPEHAGSGEILIVEDSLTQAEQLRYLLEKSGYTVRLASDGAAALDRLAARRPMLVISDIVMPVVDGYELCRRIKNDPLLQEIPVILLTSLSDPQDVIRGLNAGADNFFTKPYSEEFLLSHIKYILANKELRKRQASALGVEVFFGGQKHLITSDRLQVIDLLLSTFENAIKKNRELDDANRQLLAIQRELKALNENLEDKVSKRTARIEHLNSMLQAIRGINQLIVREKDPALLIRGACDIFVETSGYQSAWIVLCDGEGQPTTLEGRGLGDRLAPMRERLLGGMIPECLRQARDHGEIILLREELPACRDCFFPPATAPFPRMVMDLEYGGKVYGALSVAGSTLLGTNAEEQSLFREAAQDIAFALSNMKIEQERRTAEDKVHASLNEKEVLLKEIHHRVKNNLQVISSLLSTQARRIKNEEAIAAFQESRNRIKSMALIHEKLYRSDDFSRIDFADYLRGLSGTLFKSYLIDARRIALKIDTEKVFLRINTAIPCGLIVNELFSNCLRHAFPHGRSGTVEIHLRAGNDAVTLSVADDGIGLPEGFDFRNTGSMGLEVVVTLIEQLEGAIAMRRDGGTKFEITFPINRPQRNYNPGETAEGIQQ